MNELVWLGSGVLLALVTDLLLKRWRDREHRQSRELARQVLKDHGLTPQLYLATVGEEDPQLRSALDTFAFTGHIITNSKGEVVGKLSPKAEKGRHLRLVVSND